ncbi:replication initiation protein [Viridibacillus sp. NPDC093762]|uniref:replication initiation protein n=1 Tax=Viridibacillus sp. NPDC093762 TaxID=3390720 RepID=UPI003D036A44
MEQLEFDLVEVQFNLDNLVTKSNLLIESSYKLSTLESKLILTLFSNVQPNDDDINTYIFQIQPFVNMLELKGKSKYKDLRNITKGLMEKVHEIRIGDTVHQVSWLSYVAYNEGQGTISMRFDDFWKPYILQLQKNFTTYRLGSITNLNSAYSIRLYELLKQWQKIRKRTYALDELREMLGVPEGSYKLYANFKQRVLLTAQKELLEESDILFDFKEIKVGRSVGKIEFFIYHNPNFVKAEPIIPLNVIESEQKPVVDVKGYTELQFKIKSILLDWGLNEKTVDSLIETYSEKRIKSNIDYTKGRIDMGSVKKVAGYVKRAIEQDYSASRGAMSEKSAEKKVVEVPVSKENKSKSQTSKEFDVDEFIYFLNEKIKILMKIGEESDVIDQKVLNEVTTFKKRVDFDNLPMSEQEKLKTILV